PCGPHRVTSSGQLPVDLIVVDTDAALSGLQQGGTEQSECLLDVQEVPRVAHASRRGPEEPRAIALAGEQHAIARRWQHLGSRRDRVVVERAPGFSGEMPDRK